MIFIDTGAFLARYILRDQHHAAAVACWAQLKETRPRCFTSNLVLNETITLLARRTSYEFAAARAQSLYTSSSLSILRTDVNDEVAALQLLRKLADQRVSFADCISFALMRKEGIRSAFTFDHHFAIAGFEIMP